MTTTDPVEPPPGDEDEPPFQLRCGVETVIDDPGPPDPLVVTGCDDGGGTRTVKTVTGTLSSYDDFNVGSNVYYNFAGSLVTRPDGTHVELKNGDTVTVCGASIQCSASDGASWDNVFHRTTLLRIFDISDITVRECRLVNAGDGIGFRTNTANAAVVHTAFLRTHDDCIERDEYFNGNGGNFLADDCAMLQSYVLFSARPKLADYGFIDGRTSSYLIRNCVASVVQMPDFHPSSPYGNLFKWYNDGEGARWGRQGYGVPLYIDGLILYLGVIKPGGYDFRAAGYLRTASNCTLVTNSPYPYSLPPGWTNTTNYSVFSSRCAAWQAAHPGISIAGYY